LPDAVNHEPGTCCANTSGRGDLTHHHLGHESNVVTSDDIERSTVGV
jgi:hypothetical protein